MRADVIDSLLHGGDFLGVLVGNLGLELFFERHDELDRVQGIRTEVVDERRFVLDFGLVHAQLLGDDLLDSLFYVFHASPPLRDPNVQKRLILPEQMLLPKVVA